MLIRAGRKTAVIEFLGKHKIHPK